MGRRLGVMAILSIGLGWIVAGRALEPLRTMNRRARQISAENLHERLGVEGRRDELGDLAATFDALLARLEQAFEAQRRFVANASHELRTPLTLERALVEVALADPEPSVASFRQTCTRILASTEQQEHLIDTLLTLSRGQAGLDQSHQVDVAVLLEHELLARATQLAGFRVQRDLSTMIVTGDPALLERLIGNLVENAIAYNRDQGPWLSVSAGVESDGSGVLKIANGGDLIQADTVRELFVPFRRGAGERIHEHRGGLGLGLSIVQTIAAAHGATIDARPLVEGGMEFELRTRDAVIIDGTHCPTHTCAAAARLSAAAGDRAPHC
jgi:signal transduction histidine kinase